MCTTKINLRDQTKAVYNYNFDHYVRSGFGLKNLGDIKYSDLKIFYISLIKKTGLRIATVNKIQTLISLTFQMAVRDGIVRSNPCNGIIKDLSSSDEKGKTVRRALTYDEQKAFITYVAENPIFAKWFNFFTVMFGTGLRIGEALGLTWKDVDFDENEIHVNQNLVYGKMDKGEHFEYHISTTKTPAGIRTIPIAKSVRKALLDEYADQSKNGFNATVIDGINDFVFQVKEGYIGNSVNTNKAIHKICDSYNKAHNDAKVILPHFSCHQIRHTFCTRFCEHEDNLKVIQSIMGHSDITTTMNVYAEATKHRNKISIKSLLADSILFTFFKDIQRATHIGRSLKNRLREI